MRSIQERPWLLLGIFLALWGFSLTRSLPPLFRGDVCCDSTGYVKIAERLPAAAQSAAETATPTRQSVVGLLKKAFNYSGYTPPGYPIFLSLHAQGLRLIGLGSVPWLPIALFSALLLHIAAALFFYRSWSHIGLPLPQAALAIIVGHPGLASHSALPLADSFAVTMMMFGMGCLFRAQPRAAFAARHLFYACGGGACLAVAVLTRTAQLPSATACLAMGMIASAALWLVTRCRKLAGYFLLGCAGFAAFFIILSPRFVACTRATGHLCYTEPPSPGEPLTANLIRAGMTGGRTYTVLAPGGFSALVTVSDAFFDSFRKGCVIDDVRPLASLSVCLAARPLSSPVYLLKKSIALFDNMHWNTYATYVTPLWMIILNRAFGAAGFTGFFALLWIVVPKPSQGAENALRRIPLVQPVTFFLMSILLMIESRYGLPLAPFGLAGFGLLAARIARKDWRHRRMATMAGLLLGAVFLLQTSRWDALDSVRYRSVQDALGSDEPPVIEPPTMRM